jgi:signal transduction histidine kinase
MPTGGTLTTCVEDAIEEGREGLRLTIEDTGEGIPASIVPKIFEPFFTTRSATGTGIGLWLAKQFIEGHAGTLTVSSSVDPTSHGTSMSIFLPFKNPYTAK